MAQFRSDVWSGPASRPRGADKRSALGPSAYIRRMGKQIILIGADRRKVDDCPDALEAPRSAMDLLGSDRNGDESGCF